MAKSLATLARQLRRNHGLTFVPTFDDAIEPGTLLDRRGRTDLTRIGHLADDAKITRRSLGRIDGPTPSLLADLSRFHELNVDGAIELISPRTAKARAEFKRAREVVVSFGAPVSYSRSLIDLEEAIEGAEGLWDRPVGQALRSRRTALVFIVVRARISFLFRGSGSSGLHLSAGPLRKLADSGLNLGWSWRNEATLESRKEIVVAVELARYSKRKRRLLPLH